MCAVGLFLDSCKPVRPSILAISFAPVFNEHVLGHSRRRRTRAETAFVMSFFAGVYLVLMLAAFWGMHCLVGNLKQAHAACMSRFVFRRI